MLIVLVAVLVPGVGKSVNGARRWIPLIIINIQVAELAKLLAIIFFLDILLKIYPKWLILKRVFLRLLHY